MFDPNKPFYIKNKDGDEWHHGMRVICTDLKGPLGKLYAVILVDNAYSGGEDFVIINMETRVGYWLINHEYCRIVQED